MTNRAGDLTSVVKKNQRVVLMCAIGGTLDTLVSYRREKKLFNDPERAFGREYLPLIAAGCIQPLWGVGRVFGVMPAGRWRGKKLLNDPKRAFGRERPPYVLQQRGIWGAAERGFVPQ